MDIVFPCNTYIIISHIKICQLHNLIINATINDTKRIKMEIVASWFRNSSICNLLILLLKETYEARAVLYSTN